MLPKKIPLSPQTTQAGDEASQADTAIGNVVLHLHVMPYPAFYAYVFLLSTVVQMDPIGASKCLSFATAGLESLYSRSSGSDPASFTSISGAGRVTSQILRMIDMLADLLAYQCELFLMRSRLEQADRVGSTAVRTLLSKHAPPDLLGRRAILCAYRSCPTLPVSPARTASGTLGHPASRICGVLGITLSADWRRPKSATS